MRTRAHTHISNLSLSNDCRQGLLLAMNEWHCVSQKSYLHQTGLRCLQNFTSHKHHHSDFVHVQQVTSGI